MTATMDALACAGCGTPLTGGRDTFGVPGQPQMCFGCYADSPAGSDARKKFLERRINSLGYILRQAESEVNRIGDQMDEIQRELDGGPRCDEEETRIP